MLKKSLFLMTLIFSTGHAVAQESAYPNFEAELKALERHELKTEELQMRNADAVTDLFTDEVGTGQAGIMRSSVNTLDTDNSDTDVIPKRVEVKPRERRVRSR